MNWQRNVGAKEWRGYFVVIPLPTHSVAHPFRCPPIPLPHFASTFSLQGTFLPTPLCGESLPVGPWSTRSRLRRQVRQAQQFGRVGFARGRSIFPLGDVRRLSLNPPEVAQGNSQNVCFQPVRAETGPPTVPLWMAE